jgi:hypothetical protein
VEQQQLRCLRRAGLAIEDLEALDVRGTVLDFSHGDFSSLRVVAASAAPFALPDEVLGFISR